MFNLSRDFLIILSLCVYYDLYGLNKPLTLMISSSSASVGVSTADAAAANDNAVAPLAKLGKLTTFVSRLSSEEKKNELLPVTSRMSEI